MASGRICTAGVSTTGPRGACRRRAMCKCSPRSMPPRCREGALVSNPPPPPPPRLRPGSPPGDRAHRSRRRLRPGTDVAGRAAGVTGRRRAVEPQDPRRRGRRHGGADDRRPGQRDPRPRRRWAPSAWPSRSGSPCWRWPTRSGTSPAATSTRRSRWRSGSPARSRSSRPCYYWVAQVVGAFLGGLIIFIISDAGDKDNTGVFAANGWGADIGSRRSGSAPPIVVEIFFTALLIFVVLSTTTKGYPVGFGGLAAGLTLGDDPPGDDPGRQHVGQPGPQLRHGDLRRRATHSPSCGCSSSSRSSVPCSACSSGCSSTTSGSRTRCSAASRPRRRPRQRPPGWPARSRTASS